MNMHVTETVRVATPLAKVSAMPALLDLLVIADLQPQLTHMCDIARSAGVNLHEAESIEKAMSCLAAYDYDAVLVELSLGDHDGIEAIRSIVHSGRQPDLIVLSGHEDRVHDAIVRFARSAGLSVIGQFKKPLQDAEFRQCLALATLRAEHKAAQKAALNIPASDVEEAITKGEIIPAYQVQVSLETGEVIGVEALARWRSPKHGDVPPEAFVEIAEKNGLAKALSRSMLTRVIADAKPWCDRVEGFRVAVNVSPTVLSDLAFPEEVMAALQAGGLRPGNLTIEVTETTTLSDTVNIADVMSRLYIKGVSLSLDDFGQGYGSLKTLHDNAFDEIKIDRAFVAEAYRDTNAWTIVQATIALAKAHGMRIVAEGIETLVMSELLRNNGVDCGQGYLYGRPMAAAAIADRLPAR